MSLARFNGSVIDANGKAVPNANIEVRRSTGNRGLVVVYSDREGLVPRGNPFQSDSRGRFFFHVLGGSYRVRAYTGDSLAPTFETFWDFVPVGNSQELDADMLGQYLAAGIAPFPTKAALDATTPTSGYTGAIVLNDPDATKNGWYTYNTGTSLWVRRRGLPDSVAEMTVTGGDANNLLVTVSPGVDPASVKLFYVEPPLSNTGPMTINGKPLRNALGDELVSGEYPADRISLIVDKGSYYRLLSDPDVAGVAEQVLTNAQSVALIASQFGDLESAMASISSSEAASLINSEAAEDDANRAETARDASYVAAGPLYASEAAGRAAVTDGNQFTCVSSNGLSIEKRIRVSSSNSSLIASYPALVLIESMTKRLSSGSSLRTSDPSLVKAGETVVANLFGDENSQRYPASVLSTGMILLELVRLGKTELVGPVDLGGGITLIVVPDANYSIAITDPDGNVSMGVSDRGVEIYGIETDSVSRLNIEDERNKQFSRNIQSSPSARMQPPSQDVNSIIVYGQSLAVGNETWPPLSKVTKFGNLMLGGAVHPSGGVNVYTQFSPTGLQPLVAKGVSGGTILTDAQIAALAAGDQTYGENPGIGMANDISDWISRRLITTPKPFLVYCPGVGGRTIEQLSKVNNQDSNYLYGRFTSSVTQAHAAAVAAGKTHAVTSILFMQGEWDYLTDYGSTKATKALYKAALTQLRLDMIADIKAITGQTQDPLFIIYQTGLGYTRDSDMNGLPGLHVGMAQLEFALENPTTVIMAGPAYPPTDKGGHFDANGSRWYGQYASKAYIRGIIDGLRFRPLSPIKIELMSNRVIRAHFHVPVTPLRFDGPWVVNAQGNYAVRGFRVTDTGGAKAITDVSIVRDTIVEITVASDLDPATAHLWYAAQSGSSGNGMLVDSSKDSGSEVYEYLPGSGMYVSANIPSLVGKPYPTPNWCTAFYHPTNYSEL